MVCRGCGRARGTESERLGWSGRSVLEVEEEWDEAERGGA